MPSAASLTPDSRFVGLFVGPKHSGKTCAECTFISPEGKKAGKRIRVFDFDGRIRGILGAPWVDKSIIDYDYYPPKTSIGQPSTFSKVNEDFAALQVQCTLGQNQYETLILDSLTSETFAFLCDALPLTHKGEKGQTKGKNLGSMAMPGPEDYGFEAQGTYQVLAFLRSLPIPNIIVSAHVVERFGKVDPDNPYSESVVIGEKLSVRDKIGTNVGIYFDHIFRFDRRMVGRDEKFYVKFRSELACTSYPSLPTGEQDVTGKNFYEYLMSLVHPASSVAGS